MNTYIIMSPQLAIRGAYSKHAGKESVLRVEFWYFNILS